MLEDQHKDLWDTEGFGGAGHREVDVMKKALQKMMLEEGGVVRLFFLARQLSLLYMIVCCGA